MPSFIASGNKSFWVYSVAILFIVLNFFLIANEFYYLSVIPFLLLLGLFAVFSFDKILLLLVFCTPLSINLDQLIAGASLTVPTEPVLFGIMLIFFIKFFYEEKFDVKVLKHPITVLLMINLVWMGITCITSEMPIVSIKYMLSRLWFVVGFYFLGTQLFKNYKNIKRFIWLYTLPLLGVIIYTLIRHAYYGFSQESSTWIMEPFYKNHGVYAVAIAMLFPLMIIYLLKSKRFKNNLLQNATIVITNIIFLVGMIFSYTRAAWLSLAVTVMALFVFQFKVQLRTILLVVSVIAGIGLYNFHEFDMALNRNVQDSSTDFQEHVTSISNVSTNASNMERLNRWNCAIRMFIERPIVGWGPGTYMFQYGQFQKPSELTIISTNAGIRGNAHSEYLGPLAESGFLGFFTYFMLILIVIDRGMKLYYTLEDKELKYLILGILLGFITYVVHGVLNNYLDMDKAAIPFWAFVAIITSIDIYHNKTKQISDNSEQLRHQ